jgi:FolB domain-containing protein
MEIAHSIEAETKVRRQSDQGGSISVGLGSKLRVGADWRREVEQQTMDSEWIEIMELGAKARIGVPDEERQTRQELRINVRFQIEPSFENLEDRFDSTIDYSAVAKEVEKVVSESEFRLVETLVTKLADHLMQRFPMRTVEIEVNKFALPNASCVSVKATRRRGQRGNR